MKKDFKVIAIRPLEGCNIAYTKVLQVGELYTFYNEYEIKDNSIIYNASVPANLYDTKNQKINISAIVGKNGEGKSTIIELLFAAINNFAFKNDNIDTDLEKVDKIHVEIYFKTDITIYKIEINEKYQIFKYESDDQKVYRIMDNNIADSFNLNDFFYSICANYSHYALNSNEHGRWIQKTFHKNDAYQSPLVIFPMRSEGNINMNSESHLVKSRLISVLLQTSDKKNILNRNLTDKQRACSFEFSLNKKKFDYVYTREVVDSAKRFKFIEIGFDEFHSNNNNELIFKIFNEIFKININSSNDFDSRSLFEPVPYPQSTIIDYARYYILKKLVSISMTYSHYSKFFNLEKGVFCNKNSTSFSESLFKEYLNELKNDKSHITFKLRQTINFLKYDINNWIEQYSNEKIENKLNFTVSIKDLSDKLNEISIENELQIIELIPPAIFDYDIELESIFDTDNDLPVFYNMLSSGEKQLINISSSIIYHLNNINSVNNLNGGLTKYEFCNLVFEEIELYFHPDLQRRFIKFLIGSLDNQDIKNISGINICFVTHSPFILSDIPSQNIMFLRVFDEMNAQQNLNHNSRIKGKSYQEKNQLTTFGANVHDLLKNGFFMSNGFMGDLAETKIGSAIDYLESQSNKSIGYENVDNWNQYSIKWFIALIGEPLIRNSLNDLYYNAFLKTDEDIDREISRLKTMKNNRKQIIKS